MRRYALLAVGMMMVLALSGCLSNWWNTEGLERLADRISVAEAVAEAGETPPDASPIVETDVEVYGRISALGEFFCPCFVLSSGGDSVTVRYGLFADEERPDVDVEGIANGDWVLVIGTLRTADGLPPEVWASEILPAM